jgi:flagellar L-ring protein precursor FlgH
MKRWIVGMILLCASVAAAQTRQTPAPPPPADDSAAARQRAGTSLLRASLISRSDDGQAQLKDVSFFAVPEPEPRTIKKHDLITVIVREQSQFSSEAETDTKKDGSIDARLEQFIKLDLDDLQLKPMIGQTLPEVKASYQRDFKGEGSVERSDSFTARLTAEVVDVKPNGTLVLQARKTIRTDEEEQVFVLSGVCRAEDVMTDNTVLSTQLYDLELTKTHKGAVRDASKRGWIPKLLDAINPF